MQQKPESQKSKCPKCKMGKEIPCRTNSGREAMRVHRGRPFWSSLVDRHPDDCEYYIQLWRQGKIKKAPKIRPVKGANPAEGSK